MAKIRWQSQLAWLDLRKSKKSNRYWNSDWIKFSNSKNKKIWLWPLSLLFKANYVANVSETRWFFLAFIIMHPSLERDYTWKEMNAVLFMSKIGETILLGNRAEICSTAQTASDNKITAINRSTRDQSPLFHYRTLSKRAAPHSSP